MFGNIGPWELVLILLIALIVFGPGKLPDVAKGLGKAVNEFKNASSGIQKQFQDALKEDETPKPIQATVASPEKEASSEQPQEHKEASENHGGEPQA
ncbi:MAG TPA: twin-arginine translocase TatA/TatE family subunit [Syntrophomonadaceae bacterium]|nr:twin-arginine translocase TatA/TatE family subunit [Syntrophomonadaceae bacterium]